MGGIFFYFGALNLKQLDKINTFFRFFCPIRFEEKRLFSSTPVYIVGYSMVPSKISQVTFLGIHVYIRNQ